MADTTTQQPSAISLLTQEIQAAFQQAVAHQHAGQLQEACNLYRAILQIQPDHPGANYNLGAIAAQMQVGKKQPKHAKPTKPVKKMNARRGKEPGTQEMNSLVALFDQRNYTEVERLARDLTKRFPQHGFGWKLLGAALQLQGCVFRSKLDTDSTANWTAIPRQSGH